MVRKLRNIELNRLSVDEFKAAEKWPIIVILDNVRSMLNVGSLFRSCDAFNVQHLYLCGITPLPPHRDITKTALGAELAVKWTHRNDVEELIMELRKKGWKVFGIEQTSTAIPLQDWTMKKTDKVVLVFGHEVDGVSDKAIRNCDGFLEIPQFGTKHSINVSVCGGVVLWQAVQAFLKPVN